MKNKLALSIIIPVYNAAENIEKLITSFVSSKFKNVIEIICVDDGSTDASYKILKDLENSQVFLSVFHQENAGVSVARNLGIQHSSGEYIYFVDADDKINISEFDTVFSTIYKNQDDIAIFGIEDHFLMKNGKCKIKKNYVTEKSFTSDMFYKEFGAILNKHILYSPCNKMYRHDIIKKHKLSFKVDYAIGEDILFNLQYFYYVKKIAMYNNYVYIYYHDMKHTNSGSSRYQKKEWDVFLEIIKEIKELLESKQAFDDNIVAYHTFIIRKLSASLNNVYAKNAPLNNAQKLCFIENMYKTAIVQESLGDHKAVMEEKSQKLLHFLHKHHMKYAIHIMYLVRNFLGGV